MAIAMGYWLSGGQGHLVYAHVQAGFMAMRLGQLADCHDQWGTLLSITPTKH